jgi:hypothetical protein
MLLDKLINRIGDSNPQIFREFKERLTLRNIGIAVVAALIIQRFVLIYFNSQIPTPIYETTSTSKLVENYSVYCADTLCKLNEAGGYQINWQKWRFSVFACLSWILPLGVILGSVYLLVADLIREEKYGTLNFIRLSPQSAQQIFIGKIIGVPILVYLAGVTILPLHLYLGLSTDRSIPLLMSWYATIGSMWFLCSSGAVLYVLMGGIQAIVTTIVVAYPVWIALDTVNTSTLPTIDLQEWSVKSSLSISWFWLPITSSAIGFYAFIIGCCCIASYGIWQVLARRYLNPTAIVMSKSQSYLVNLCFQGWIAGFFLPAICSRRYYYVREQMIFTLAVIDFIALLLLIPALLPSKQSLQDWSRYRRERVTHQNRKFWQRGLIQDLINNDKSPTILTIAINTGMAMLVWIVAAIGFGGVRSLAGVFLAASLILIYATIAHLGLFLNVKKRNLWIVGGLGGLMILPLFAAFVLSPDRSPTGFAAILLLFSPFASQGIYQLGWGAILATFCAQVTILGALTRRLQRTLQIAGRSPSKELLPHS